MYQIKKINGDTVYSDTLIYVRVLQNGAYTPCDKSEAEGFCVKLVGTVIDEEIGEEYTTLIDTVYALSENGLNGIEPVGNIESVNGTLLISERDEVLDILLGGEN